MHEILNGVNMRLKCELGSVQLDKKVKFNFTYSFMYNSTR